MSQHRLLSGADTDIIHPRFVINIFPRAREVDWQVVLCALLPFTPPLIKLHQIKKWWRTTCGYLIFEGATSSFPFDQEVLELIGGQEE